MTALGGADSETSPSGADADDTGRARPPRRARPGTPAEPPLAELPTPQRILRAARELFHENGYHATGIAAILRKADVKSGSLYHFFPTKEDLLLGVLDAYHDLLEPMLMRPVFERISDPIERIFGVLDGYRQMLIITGCSLGCPIGNLALELADTHPQAREGITANFDQWKRSIEQCLDAAADRFPADLDRARLASFILTVMEGGMMQAKTYRSLEPFDAAVTSLRDYIDRLLEDGGIWKGH